MLTTFSKWKHTQKISLRQLLSKMVPVLKMVPVSYTSTQMFQFWNILLCGLVLASTDVVSFPTHFDSEDKMRITLHKSFVTINSQWCFACLKSDGSIAKCSFQGFATDQVTTVDNKNILSVPDSSMFLRIQKPFFQICFRLVHPQENRNKFLPEKRITIYVPCCWNKFRCYNLSFGFWWRNFVSKYEWSFIFSRMGSNHDSKKFIYSIHSCTKSFTRSPRFRRKCNSCISCWQFSSRLKHVKYFCVRIK